LCRSWQHISYRWIRPNRDRQIVDYLDADEDAREQFGYSCRPGDTIVEHQLSIAAAAYEKRRHINDRSSKAGDLSLKLERVGPRAPTGRKP
jgi:hypothetical protein